VSVIVIEMNEMVDGRKVAGNKKNVANKPRQNEIHTRSGGVRRILGKDRILLCLPTEDDDLCSCDW
jgi:hypothetical protein